MTLATTLKKYSTLFLLFFFSAYFAHAAVIPERPKPARLVNNLSASGFLSPDEENRLERKLEAFANETSNQIVIVIVDDLGGLEPFEYATNIGKEWGVGQSKEDNGVVILIKPTGGKGERKYFIATGLGLEGVLPDITCRQIEENELVPAFKAGKYYEGLDKTTDVIMSIAKGEYDSAAYGAKNKNSSGKWKLGLLLLVIIVFIIVSIKGGGRGNGGMSMGTGFFLGSMLGGRGGFGGGGGGGSSGGFGGFGGGGFGGGGSGGSW